MRFGLFCNQQRARADVGASWREDIDEIVLGDQLGFEQAWISEHTGSPWLPDALPSPDHMICALAMLTKTIRLGPAIRRLALYHPLQVAIEAAVCDQLTGGRYMFGFGRGGPVSGWGQRGTAWEETHDMMVEGIDLIMRCFDEREPFDFEGRFYRGREISVYPKPVQEHGPRIAVATGNPTLLALAARRDFDVLTSQFATPGEIFRLAQLFEGAGAAERARDKITAVRGIFVGDTDAAAVSAVKADWERHLAFNRKHFPVNFKNWVGDGSVADAKFDRLHGAGLMFVGSAETVEARIREFHEQAGGFGTLLLVTGRDWGSFEQRSESMRRFMSDVAPRLADLGPVVAPMDVAANA